MSELSLLNHLETYITPNRQRRFTMVAKERTQHFCVAVEDVYQLHNTSAVMRSCDVFGIQDLHVVEEINTKKIDREIALGAQKWVDVYRYNHISDCISNIRQKGYQIVATSPHAEASYLEDFDVSKKSCFFFGRETEGLSQQVLDAADTTIKIPMYGFTESLNISVSAAIILQQLTSKLRSTNISWQLSEKEQKSLRLKWIKQTLKDYDKIVQRLRQEEK